MLWLGINAILLVSQVLWEKRAKSHEEPCCNKGNDSS